MLNHLVLNDHFLMISSKLFGKILDYFRQETEYGKNSPNMALILSKHEPDTVLIIQWPEAELIKACE